MASDKKRSRDDKKRSKKKKSKKKSSKQKKNKSSSKRKNKKKYQTMDDPVVHEAPMIKLYEDEPWCLACDCGKCLNGRCGVGWLPIIALLAAAVFVVLALFGGALGVVFETGGNDTLAFALCSNCTHEPTSNPTPDPTLVPTVEPTLEPTGTPTLEPTAAPSVEPTLVPTDAPSVEPTSAPSVEPTLDPTDLPTVEPTFAPTADPTLAPTNLPTVEPTSAPTLEPSAAPTNTPTMEPTAVPTSQPTVDPTNLPTVERISSGTSEPTVAPTTGGGTSTTPGSPTSAHKIRRRISDMNVKKFTPNIMLILIENFGWSDFSALETSAIQEFLDESYTFLNFNGQSSLTTIMTGRETANNYEHNVHSKTPTWPELLKRKGYSNRYHGECIYERDSLNGDTTTSKGSLERNISLTSGLDFSATKLLPYLRSVKPNEKWSVTLSFGGGPCSFSSLEIGDYCNIYFETESEDFNLNRGRTCERMRYIDNEFANVIHELKNIDLWGNYIIMLTGFNSGNNRTFFSIGGGALPASLLSCQSQDLVSSVDVAPTIMSIAGFSENELADARLDGRSMVEINPSFNIYMRADGVNPIQNETGLKPSSIRFPLSNNSVRPMFREARSQ